MDKRYWITNEKGSYTVWFLGYQIAEFTNNTLAEEYIQIKSTEPRKWAASLDNMKDTDAQAVRAQYSLDNLLAQEKLVG